MKPVPIRKPKKRKKSTPMLVVTSDDAKYPGLIYSSSIEDPLSKDT